MKKTKKIVNHFLPKIVGLKLNSLYLVKPQKAIQKAYELFSTPRKGQIKPEQVNFLKSAKSTKVLVNDLKLQTYHWKGEGKTVILVHGWDSNTYRWKDLVLDLQTKNFNIIAFDAPAHGNSEGQQLSVPLYAECLDHIIELYQPNFLIGHSVGGMTLVYNQYLNYTEHIEKMVLLGAPSEMKSIMSDYKRILNLNTKFILDLNVFFKAKFGYHFEEFSIAKFAKSIKQNTLIIHDQYDKVAPVSAAKSIAKSLEHSKLVITEGAGHSLYKAEIRQEIIEFLEAKS
ncbi:alpha/beta hydrolase [Psychroflexus aestuariivivens]|uniref:alpha/beta hydrolase n=1 Tax=Psychroflexus aestuariivivens TaxID=1795040 RepID=UPI000FD9564C|nr:alpha/beta hydrolase [Psychroflexus aestuariivivens]